MKYHGKADFVTECVHLRRTPENATEAYNKLVCLMQLEQRFDTDANRLYVKPLSKRRERLTRMFYAYKNLERW